MRPNKIGQVAKFHTPYPDEEPNQLFVMLEVIEDTLMPRAKIRAIFADSVWESIRSVQLADLESVELGTDDLIGLYVTINKEDLRQVKRRVISVKQKKIMLDLTKRNKGVETNVWMTILDQNRLEHTGTLFVTHL